MEDTLNHLKFLNMLSPRGIHIPNCDKKGFYKKKQVSTIQAACSSPLLIRTREQAST